MPKAIVKGAAAVVSALGSCLRAGDALDPGGRRKRRNGGDGWQFLRSSDRELKLVGVTGTNGKTTTTYIVESILKAAERPAAVLGTIEYRGPGFDVRCGTNDTRSAGSGEAVPPSRRCGWQYAVMEISSHAIEMKRVAGLNVEVAVFTNLSRDHLDFHGDMETYFRAKQKIVRRPERSADRGEMVLNLDDRTLRRSEAIDPSRVISYGMQVACRYLSCTISIWLGRHRRDV